MKREDLEKIVQEVLGETHYVTGSDLMMAAIVYELREVKKSSKPANVVNVATPVYSSRDSRPLVTTVPVESWQAMDMMPGDEEVTRVGMDYPPHVKIPVIKAIRTALGLGLKEAKDLSEMGTFVATRWQLRALADVFDRELPRQVALYPIK